MESTRRHPSRRRKIRCRHLSRESNGLWSDSIFWRWKFLLSPWWSCPMFFIMLVRVWHSWRYRHRKGSAVACPGNSASVTKEKEMNSVHVSAHARLSSASRLTVRWIERRRRKKDHIAIISIYIRHHIHTIASQWLVLWYYLSSTNGWWRRRPPHGTA